MKTKASENLNPPTLGQLVSLKVDGISQQEGKGVARLNSLVYFVEQAVPGDELLVEVTKVKKNFAEAKIVEIIKPSQNRIEAECPYFGSCGGCSLQMMTYESQLEFKKEMLKHAFRNFFVGEMPDLEPSAPWRYRNRIQLKKQKKKVGYYKRNSKELVAIEDCLIADPKITEKLSPLRAKKEEGAFELALNQKGEVKLRNLKSRDPRALLFSQVNQEVNLKLQDYVLKKAKALLVKGTAESGPGQILDLYSGNGNFSFLLAEAFKGLEVQAVELSASSVKEAQKQKQARGGLDKLRFVSSDVRVFLEKAQGLNKSASDLVLLDPPRSGCDKGALEALKGLAPKNIIYISCHLAAAVRDLKVLSESYKVESVQGFDMFPQTAHLETCFVLVKA